MGGVYSVGVASICHLGEGLMEFRRNLVGGVNILGLVNKCDLEEGLKV